LRRHAATLRRQQSGAGQHADGNRQPILETPRLAATPTPARLFKRSMETRAILQAAVVLVMPLAAIGRRELACPATSPVS